MIPYSKTQKVLLGAVAATCVVWVAASVAKHHYADKLSQADGRASVFEAQIKDAMFDVATSRTRESLLRDELGMLNATLKQREADLAKTKIPAVKPLPNGPSDVQVELLAKGVAYQYGESNTLTVDTSRMVLEAFNHIEAYDVAKKRIDALQGTLDAYNAVVLKQNDLLNQKDVTIKSMTVVIGTQAKRDEATKEMIASMKKEHAAGEVKWWIKAGGAAVAGYLVGKHIR